MLIKSQTLTNKWEHRRNVTLCLRSMVCVPELGSEGYDFFDICNVFKEGAIRSGTSQSLDVTECRMDNCLDKRGVTTGRGDADLADSRSGNV